MYVQWGCCFVVFSNDCIVKYSMNYSFTDLHFIYYIVKSTKVGEIKIYKSLLKQLYLYASHKTMHF